MKFVKKVSEHSRDMFQKRNNQFKKVFVHLRDRMRKIIQKINNEISCALLYNKFNFKIEKTLNKNLTFNTKRTNEEKIIDHIIESLPVDNDFFYIKHRPGQNVSTLRKEDENKIEKDEYVKVILIYEGKMKKDEVINNMKNYKALIKVKREAIKRLKELGVEYVETND